MFFILYRRPIGGHRLYYLAPKWAMKHDIAQLKKVVLEGLGSSITICESCTHSAGFQSGILHLPNL